MNALLMAVGERTVAVPLLSDEETAAAVPIGDSKSICKCTDFSVAHADMK